MDFYAWDYRRITPGFQNLLIPRLEVNWIASGIESAETGDILLLPVDRIQATNWDAILPRGVAAVILVGGHAI